MQLLILILRSKQDMDAVLVALLQAGFGGGTLLDCEGALQALADSHLKKPDAFLTLQQYLNPTPEPHKLLLMAVKTGDIARVQAIVDTVTGGLDQPNTGVLMTVPLGVTDGISL